MILLLDLFKFGLGTRNLTRFFPAPSTDDVLNSFLDAGREALARRKPIVQTCDVSITNATCVPLPAAILWPKTLLLDGVLLNEMQRYPNETRDREVSLDFSPFEPVDMPFPDSNETTLLGDWSFDAIRKVIVFQTAKTGTVTVGGFGIPATMNELDRSRVVTFALVKAYETIIAKLIAKPDLQLPGFAIKQHLPEMRIEARELKKQFDDDTITPYASVTRS